MWGGATFDVAMRFLKESPWDRLAQLREAVPNVLLADAAAGLATRSATRTTRTTWSRDFVTQAADAGIDLFRIFDSLNWVENMRVAIDAVLEPAMLCEAAICYTGDITDPSRDKYDLAYYVDMAKAARGRRRPHARRSRTWPGSASPRPPACSSTALREEIGLPIHFHTHDTSGAAAASVLAASAAGVDAVDLAMDPMSGLTSQPNLGSVVEALRGSPRDTGLPREELAFVASYWEAVRAAYAGFESDMRAGAAEVYEHEMPGGQYTNLRQQARALGIESRWREVAKAYAAVNRMFGDIVKVTPTSKVVGDLAVFMVTNDLTPEEVLDPRSRHRVPRLGGGATSTGTWASRTAASRRRSRRRC